MPGKAAKVVITERQQDILQRWVGSRSCPKGLAQRAEIVLLASPWTTWGCARWLTWACGWPTWPATGHRS